MPILSRMSCYVTQLQLAKLLGRNRLSTVVKSAEPAAYLLVNGKRKALYRVPAVSR
jgi:hypothetical protein